MRQSAIKAAITHIATEAGFAPLTNRGVGGFTITLANPVTGAHILQFVRWDSPVKAERDAHYMVQVAERHGYHAALLSGHRVEVTPPQEVAA